MVGYVFCRRIFVPSHLGGRRYVALWYSSYHYKTSFSIKYRMVAKYTKSTIEHFTFQPANPITNFSHQTPDPAAKLPRPTHRSPAHNIPHNVGSLVFLRTHMFISTQPYRPFTVKNSPTHFSLSVWVLSETLTRVIRELGSWAPGIGGCVCRGGVRVV